MTTSPQNNPNNAFIGYQRPLHSYHNQPPSVFMTQPMTTYQNFNTAVSPTQVPNMTSQQVSTAVTSLQHACPSNHTNFYIDQLVSRETGYPQQASYAFSNGVSPPQQLNSNSSSPSNGAYNTPNQSEVTSQTAQQRNDVMTSQNQNSVMTSQLQISPYQTGNPLYQNYNVHHQGQLHRYTQAGFHGDYGADVTTLQPQARIECY